MGSESVLEATTMLVTYFSMLLKEGVGDRNGQIRHQYPKLVTQIFVYNIRRQHRCSQIWIDLYLAYLLQLIESFYRNQSIEYRFHLCCILILK